MNDDLPRAISVAVGRCWFGAVVHTGRGSLRERRNGRGSEARAP
jgi:hypothetical protein